MRAIDIGAIRARRAMLTDQIGHHRREISVHQQEIGNHEQAIVSLESKLADLDVAERVFAEIEDETSDAEDAPVPRPRHIDTARPDSLDAATESEAAHPGAQEKDSLVSDAETDREAARSDVSPKIAQAIAQAAELWLRPSEEISAAEIGRVVGLSTRTLYNRLGPREMARQSADPDEIDVAKSNEPPPGWEAGRATKPEGTPMVAEMILEALNLAISEGKTGLRVSELIAFVRDRYWPEVPANSVGPVAWKMSKTGKLQNKNSVYSLRNDDELAPRKRRRGRGKKEPLNKARPRKQSIADRAVQECIRIIRERGQPVSGRDLCAVLAQRGIKFGGKTSQAQRLAHCLSVSGELVADHSRGNKTRGWSLKEWSQPPDSHAGQDEPEDELFRLSPSWEQDEAAE
jgi:hypothetical protein